MRDLEKHHLRFNGEINVFQCGDEGVKTFLLDSVFVPVFRQVVITRLW